MLHPVHHSGWENVQMLQCCYALSTKKVFITFHYHLRNVRKSLPALFSKSAGPVYMHWDRYWRAPQGTSATSHTDAKDIGLLSILEINMEFIEAAHVPLGAK